MAKTRSATTAVGVGATAVIAFVKVNSVKVWAGQDTAVDVAPDPGGTKYPDPGEAQ